MTRCIIILKNIIFFLKKYHGIINSSSPSPFKSFKNGSKCSLSNSIYLSELSVPSTNTNGPNLLLQKHPQTITPIEFFTVSFKQSALYRSFAFRQTQFLDSLLKSSYRDLSLQII